MKGYQVFLVSFFTSVTVFLGGLLILHFVLKPFEPVRVPVPVNSKVDKTFTKKVDVPDIKGLTVEQAKNLLKQHRFGIFIEGYINSDSFKKNTIAWQKPFSGSFVDEGSTILVKLSLGKKKLKMPDVVGLPEEVAISILKESGITQKNNFFVKKVYEKSKSKKGIVLRTEPDASEVLAGGKVVLTISKGEELVKVPKLKKLYLYQAIKKLKNTGLKVGKITYISTDYYDDKQVIKSDPEEGKMVEKGTKVDLKVAIENY